MPQQSRTAALYKRADSPKQKVERRQMILRAATAEMERLDSITDFTMEALSKRTGLAKGTVYLYFNNKNSLFLALLEDAIQSLMSDIYTKIATLDKPVEAQKMAHVIRDELIRSVKMKKFPWLLRSLSEEGRARIESPRIREKFELKMNPFMDRVDEVLVKSLDGLRPGNGNLIMVYAWSLLLGFSEILDRKPKRSRSKSRMNAVESVEQGVGDALTLIIEALAARSRQVK